MWLELQFPHPRHKGIYDDFVEELKRDGTFLKHPERLFDYTNIDFDWVLQKVSADAEQLDPKRVPAVTLFFIDTESNILIWAVNIRQHIHHPNLIHRWWHIWYGVRPRLQGRWFATKMLWFALEEAKKMWIEKTLLTCSIENAASRRVIEKNGGVFESEQQDINGENFFRYWIDIK